MKKLFKIGLSEFHSRINDTKYELDRFHSAGFSHGDFIPSNTYRLNRREFAGPLGSSVPLFFPRWRYTNGIYSIGSDMKQFTSSSKSLQIVASPGFWYTKETPTFSRRGNLSRSRYSCEPDQVMAYGWWLLSTTHWYNSRSPALWGGDIGLALQQVIWRAHARSELIENRRGRLLGRVLFCWGCFPGISQLASTRLLHSIIRTLVVFLCSRVCHVKDTRS